MNEPAVLRATGLAKTYLQGDHRIPVLRHVTLAIGRGERVAVLGRSGSGKSTLLHLLAGLDDADSGEVQIAEHSLTAASQAERARLRNRYMGFVYQLHHLLPEFSALENVAMPLLLQGRSRRDARNQAAAVLASVGLEHRLTHRPAALSGGERQRVAVARAVVANPLVVLADEPTGSLDSDNAEQVFELLCRLSDEQGTGLLIVTHDESTLARMHRVLRLEEGELR